MLRGLLDGSRTLEGLEVDADARWAFLSGLVAIGAAGDAEIDAEAERDATATGVRRAATARALRPTAESKAETWERAFHDDSVPNAVHEAMLLGFWHPAQRKLTAEYVERYFADIRPLWDRRPGEIAKNAVQYLFPPVVEPRTIVAADAWLADADQPPPLRRLIFEGRDGIARALRARERDADAARSETADRSRRPEAPDRTRAAAQRRSGRPWPRCVRRTACSVRVAQRGGVPGLVRHLPQPVDDAADEVTGRRTSRSSTARRARTRGRGSDGRPPRR